MSGDATGAVVHLDVVRAKRGADAGTLLAIAHVDDTTRPVRRRAGGGIIAAGLASLLLHGTMLAYLIVRPPDAIGGGGMELDAVSVEIISAAALESLSSKASINAAGGNTVEASAPGVESPVEQAEVAAAPPPKEQTVKPTEAVLKLDQSVPDAELVAAEVTKPKPVEYPEVLQDAKPEPEQQPDTAPAAAQAAIIAGGMSSRAASESFEAAGAAGASPGELARYAIDVRLALGKSRPRHTGTPGRVQVSFAIDEAGAIRLAEISRSSGSDDLDQLALKAIRRTQFPRPPAGTSEKQRTFIVPFDFR